MDRAGLIALSNECEKSQGYISEKEYSKIGTAGSFIVALYLGVTVLSSPSNNITSLQFSSDSPYIQYTNIGNDEGNMNLYASKSIDLMQVENLNKIAKMSYFSKDWNGTGGSAFSEGALMTFSSIIRSLDKQPQIAPTGRNTLLMQYELDDKSLLAFEVGEKRVDKVYVPQGDYSKAKVETFLENFLQLIEESVRQFYGFK